MSELDVELKALKRKEEQLVASLSFTRQRVREKELAIAKRDHGVEPGVIVREKRSGDEYRVTKVDPTSWGSPYLTGHKKLKGGEFSAKRELRVYGEWEIVEGVE